MLQFKKKPCHPALTAKFQMHTQTKKATNRAHQGEVYKLLMAIRAIPWASKPQFSARFPTASIPLIQRCFSATEHFLKGHYQQDYKSLQISTRLQKFGTVSRFLVFNVHQTVLLTHTVSRIDGSGGIMSPDSSLRKCWQCTPSNQLKIFTSH